MLIQVDESIWFDNEKLFIINGKENKITYENRIGEYPDCIKREKSDEEYKPVLIFISALSCNLRCKYCYAGEGEYGREQKNKMFSLESYIKIFDHFYKKHNGIAAINFFGGEPLLNFKVIREFVKYLHENYSENLPVLAVASNGTIMNDEIKQFIIDYNIGFGSSLDGTKAYNDTVRIGNAYDSVYDEVEKTFKELQNINVMKKVQFTLSRIHMENYVKEDFFYWADDFQKLSLRAFEIAPVMTDDMSMKIDLENEKIRNNYIQFCEDIAEYTIQQLLSKNPKKTIPLAGVGIMLRIMKREFQNDCAAGYSVAVTPDNMIFPCQAFADDPSKGVLFDENIDEKMEVSESFIEMKNAKRLDGQVCKDCIGRSICSYWCKGFSKKVKGNASEVFEERCLLVQTITKKIVKFLANEYKENKENVMKNILYYNKGAKSDDVA